MVVEVDVVEVVEVVLEVVDELVVVVGLVVVVVGRVVEVVLLVDVDEEVVEVAGVVSGGEESSSLRRARKISTPAASRMATTRATMPMVGHGERLGGGPAGPPGSAGPTPVYPGPP